MLTAYVTKHTVRLLDLLHGYIIRIVRRIDRYTVLAHSGALC